MFDFNKLGVYSHRSNENKTSFVRISYVGSDPISFLDNSFIDKDFKKINVIVLIHQGNSVFLDDEKLPHATVIESDMKGVIGLKTNDAILKETAKRAAYNAGTTIQYNSLSLLGKVENEEVYYIYSGIAGTKLNSFAKTIPLSHLTKNAFLNQCTLDEIRF